MRASTPRTQTKRWRRGRLGGRIGVPLAVAGVLAASSVMTAIAQAPSSASGGALGVSAGIDHTCAVTASGGVECWGFDDGAQLGNGEARGRKTSPDPVIGLSSGFLDVAAGGHSCALSDEHGLKCWGTEVGDGKHFIRKKPVDVLGLTSGVQQVSVGGPHSCALTDSGGVKCWGSNRFGQLGDGTNQDRNAPVDVAHLSHDVVAVAAGWYHSCALTTAGGVKCWGSGAGGALGDGTSKDRRRPVDVVGLTSGVQAIAAGSAETCALTDAGGVKCWGANDWGQLGDGTTTPSSVPVDVSELSSGVAAISVGGAHVCALTDSGGVKCWGNNLFGELGDGSRVDRHTPVDVAGLTSGVSAISAGGEDTCALTTEGGVECWGNNKHGQLGDGTTKRSLTPAEVVGF